MSNEIKTTTERSRRTWLEKLQMWPRAYKTKISDGRREAIGRGPTPEASQEATERRLAGTVSTQGTFDKLRMWLLAFERKINEIMKPFEGSFSRHPKKSAKGGGSQSRRRKKTR